ETCTKKVPVTVTKMVTEGVRKQVPYTVVRTVRGCYVDVGNGVSAGANCCGTCAPGVNVGSLKGYDCEGQGRGFVEGASCVSENVYTTTRMVQERVTRKVPVTVTRMVSETCVKKVPYTVCKMVPHTVQKCVPTQVCKMVKEECVKHVPTTVCTMQTCNVQKCVPYS